MDPEKVNAFVRPLALLTVLITVCILTYLGKIDPEKSFLPLATMIVVWWFRSRDEAKKS